MKLITENRGESIQEENNDAAENNESDEDNNDDDEDEDDQLSLTPEENQFAQSLKPPLPTERPLSLTSIKSFRSHLIGYLKDEFNITVDPLVLNRAIQVEFSTF